MDNGQPHLLPFGVKLTLVQVFLLEQNMYSGVNCTPRVKGESAMIKKTTSSYTIQWNLR